MQYNVTYIVIGSEQVCEAEMSQRELDECRATCEIVEAVEIID